MSFPSRAWSSETLIRGLGQVAAASQVEMADMPDPDPEALQAELARLEVS